MNSVSSGSEMSPTSGRLTRSTPVGASVCWISSSRAASRSSRMRRQRTRKRSPSAVRVMLRVLRWNSRTPSACSSRDTVLPAAEAEMPSMRPVSTKLRVSATCTKVCRLPRLSRADMGGGTGRKAGTVAVGSAAGAGGGGIYPQHCGARGAMGAEDLAGTATCRLRPPRSGMCGAPTGCFTGCSGPTVALPHFPAPPCPPSLTSVTPRTHRACAPPRCSHERARG